MFFRKKSNNKIKSKYVDVNVKGVLYKKDVKTGKVYSTKNDGSLWEEITMDDIESMGTLLDKLRDYDRENK